MGFLYITKCLQQYCVLAYWECYWRFLWCILRQEQKKTTTLKNNSKAMEFQNNSKVFSLVLLFV